MSLSSQQLVTPVRVKKGEEKRVVYLFPVFMVKTEKSWCCSVFFAIASLFKLLTIRSILIIIVVVYVYST